MNGNKVYEDQSFCVFEAPGDKGKAQAKPFAVTSVAEQDKILFRKPTLESAIRRLEQLAKAS